MAPGAVPGFSPRASAEVVGKDPDPEGRRILAHGASRGWMAHKGGETRRVVRTWHTHSLAC